jgi:hypothetical protein
MYSGISDEEATRHQQRYPIKRDAPRLTYTWNGDGTLGAKKEASPKSSHHQPSAWEVVGKKRDTKHSMELTLKVEDSEEVGSVKLEETSDQEDSKQVLDDAVEKAKAKKAKKAAKRARKLAQALEDAKPPVGPKEPDSEDSGNHSDWTQTSWSPSWASDSE